MTLPGTVLDEARGTGTPPELLVDLLGETLTAVLESARHQAGE